MSYSYYDILSYPVFLYPLYNKQKLLCFLTYCSLCLFGYLCMSGRKIAAIQGENVYPAWDDFSTLQQTPFHCKVQMSCNKKLCSGSSGAAVRTGNSTERTLLYEQKHYFETLMIAAPIGVLLSLLARALAERCPILTWASHLGAVKRSADFLLAVVKPIQPSRGKKTPKENGKWWRKRYESNSHVTWRLNLMALRLFHGPLTEPLCRMSKSFSFHSQQGGWSVHLMLSLAFHMDASGSQRKSGISLLILQDTAYSSEYYCKKHYEKMSNQSTVKGLNWVLGDIILIAIIWLWRSLKFKWIFKVKETQWVSFILIFVSSSKSQWFKIFIFKL